MTHRRNVDRQSRLRYHRVCHTHVKVRPICIIDGWYQKRNLSEKEHNRSISRKRQRLLQPTFYDFNTRDDLMNWMVLDNLSASLQLHCLHIYDMLNMSGIDPDSRLISVQKYMYKNNLQDDRNMPPSLREIAVEETIAKERMLTLIDDIPDVI